MLGGVVQPGYPIRTARLNLRPFRPGDLDDLFAYHSRPDVARYLLWDARGRSEVADALQRRIRQRSITAEGQSLVLAVVYRDAGRVVGDVKLEWLSREHRQGEIGFVFHPGFHGQGLATEAAQAVLGLGFDDLGLHRIIARCDARNHPSARLMERLGMRREAHFVHNEIFKGQWGDELVYAMLSDEWRASHLVQQPHTSGN